jgi:carbamoylphosphate synthase large subunit
MQRAGSSSQTDMPCHRTILTDIDVIFIECVLQATIMTDPGMADRTYVTPMTPELVEQILQKVRTPDVAGLC